MDMKRWISRAAGLAVVVTVSMGPPVWARLVAQPAPKPQMASRISSEARGDRVARLVQEGKDALIDSDVLRAHRRFQRAVRLDPQHPEANFYLALTRLLSWSMRHRADANAVGFTGPNRTPLQQGDLNPLQFIAAPPSVVSIPDKFSRGAQVQRFLARQYVIEVQRSQDNLARIPEEGFRSLLPVRNPLTGSPAIEIDDADVRLSQAALNVAAAQIFLSQVYNLDVELEDVAERIESGVLGPPDALFAAYPEALRLRNAAQAADAKTALIDAIDQYLEADALIRSETDDQSDDLFSFSSLPEDVRKEDAFRRALVDLRKSLAGLSDDAWTLSSDQLLHLGDVFDRPLDLRSLETGEGFQAALLSHLLYQSERALTNLRKAPVTFSEQVDPQDWGVSSTQLLEVDYGDLLALQTGLHSLNTAVHLLTSYNAEAYLPEIVTDAMEQTFDVEDDVLTPHPDLLRVQDLTALAEAKLDAQETLERALDTSAYVRLSDDADQQDDLFRLEGGFAELEAHWRPQVEALHGSFQALIDLDPGRVGDEFRLNLNPAFDVPVVPRTLLPQFDGASPVSGTLPDPTLGGILPDFTQEDWE